MLRKTSLFLFVISLSFSFSQEAYAQPTWTLDPFGKEKKPEKYEEKKLGSEKTADKKFTPVRKFIQNNVSHYNFYFNANNKINAVIERAKMAQRDDYSKLLSFYPYSFENTKAQQIELDSVIYKATAGILLHDLRSDWVDNFYLLIGKAYYLRQELDSAALTFQFINYNLFPRKKKEDDSRIVGANENAKNSVISIANKEDRNLLDKAFTKPPSRNDALIWLTRTLTDRKEFGDAAGLINILQHDPNLPQRLRNDLAEVTSYWFYAQNNYDSSAYHLEEALSTAENKQDLARWEYLLAQMYEMTGEHEKASRYYGRASKHTVNPVLDIFARLNDAKMFRKDGNTKELGNSISRLLQMAKKDKYRSYRDIIYYSTGQLSLQQPDTSGGISFYNRSLFYNENNTVYKSRAFLQLANIAYDQRNYKTAFAYYDSLQLNSMGIDDPGFDINARRNSLAKVVSEMEIIAMEDSLQMIAKMLPDEREVFLNKLLKRYRKERGLKDDAKFEGNSIITFNNSKGGPVDLFASTSNPLKGEWYFYNSSLKSRGFNEFKQKWGRRMNVDNWRRKSSSEELSMKGGGGIDPLGPADSSKFLNANAFPVDITMDALKGNIPLTTEKLDSSNQRLAASLLSLGKLLQFELEDHEQAIAAFDEYLMRFPGRAADEAYLGLYYSYNKLGNMAKASYYKNLLTTKYPQSIATTLLLNPASTQPDKNNPAVTKRYEEIYNKFIEGRFAEALASKKKEDSIYGKTYWTPQLLYIESIHYIKEKNDSSAIAVLNNISSLYPASTLSDKAKTLVEVLGRRKEIENYLTNLQVTRAEENMVVVGDDKPATVVQPVVKPVVKTIEPVKVPKATIVKDTIRAIPGRTAGAFTFEPEKPHYVMMILDKVDGVYINEARNAFLRYNREKFYNQTINITKDQLDTDKALLLFAQFEDADAAVLYYDKIKKAAPAEVSWLQASKYSFIIISESNLQLLKTNKDLRTFKALMNSQFGNRF